MNSLLMESILPHLLQSVNFVPGLLSTVCKNETTEQHYLILHSLVFLAWLHFIPEV